MGDESTEALINVEAVARMLGIKAATLYTWRLRGEGPKSYSVGGSVKYRRSDINRWLERNATPARLSEGTSE